MKIAIVSDLHANYDALQSLPDDYDELWVLGDLVNYGPEPAEVIAFIRAKASVAVRGNHDHSVGFGEDPRCAERFREMAAATRRWTESILSAQDKQYLKELPLTATVQRGTKHFYLCHALPSDPLFGYCARDSSRWFTEVKQTTADILLVGHTHIPYARKINRQVIVNPGSLGQPKSGSPLAQYIAWEDGKLSFCSFEYPVEETVAKIEALPIGADVKRDLIEVLRTGSISMTTL